MEQYNKSSVPPSRPTWESLETFARQGVQQLLQKLLEEEVTELLGRERSERRTGVDAQAGYRNGYGKPRQLTMSSGTIKIKRPRVRGLEERFESTILPLFKRQTNEIGRLLPELYLHGLAEGDFDLALRGLLGEGAPLSASSIARLKEGWQGEYEAWKKQSLKDIEAVYLWVDGVYVKAGLEKDKAALLVVIAGLRDGQKQVLSIEAGHRESTESWASILRDLKSRGLEAPRLVVGDGALGIWGGLASVYPESEEQRCWNHRIINILDRLSKKQQRQGTLILTRIPYAETREQAEQLKREFQGWCEKKGAGEAGRLLDHDWERMVSFYDFPKQHWKHLRTTNVIGSPFAAVRLRTTAAKRYKKVENATAVIWKVLRVVEKSFRRLDAPELLPDVLARVSYVNGIRVRASKANEKVTA